MAEGLYTVETIDFFLVFKIEQLECELDVTEFEFFFVKSQIVMLGIEKLL